MPQAETPPPSLHHHHSLINNHPHYHDHESDHNPDGRHDDNDTPDDVYFGEAHYDHDHRATLNLTTDLYYKLHYDHVDDYDYTTLTRDHYHDGTVHDHHHVHDG